MAAPHSGWAVIVCCRYRCHGYEEQVGGRPGGPAAPTPMQKRAAGRGTLCAQLGAQGPGTLAAGGGCAQGAWGAWEVWACQQAVVWWFRHQLRLRLQALAAAGCKAAVRLGEKDGKPWAFVEVRKGLRFYLLLKVLQMVA